MSGQNPSVVDFPTPAQTTGGNGGGNGKNVLQRLSVLEERTKHLATKEDIKSLETLIAEKESKHFRWMTGIFISAGVSIFVALLAVVAALIKTFFSGP